MPSSVDGRAPATVSVVIPNWNGAAHLRRCLDGLAAQTRRAERVVVVDNGSTDESLEMMATDYPWVEVIALPVNTGFAPAVNVGIRAVDTDLIGLLNNDAVPNRDWLATLLEAEQVAGPEVGFLTSKIVTADGRFIDSAGDFLDDAGIAHQRGNGEPDTGQYDGQARAFSACGCATIYRREMFADVGLFDDDFFAYYEDVDLCLRATLRSWQGQYIGSAVVQHAVSATSGSMTSFKLFQGVRNSWYVLLKGIPGPLLPTVLPRFILVQLIWFLRAARAGDATVVARAYLAVLRAAPRLLRQRRQIQGRSNLPAAELSALLAPSGMRRRLSGVVAARLANRARTLSRLAQSEEPRMALVVSSMLDPLPADARSGQVLVVGGADREIASWLDRGVTHAEPGTLPFAGAVFDATVVVDFLAGVAPADRRDALSELLRVTRPGGAVVLAATERGEAALSVDGMRSLLKGLPSASVTVVRSAPVLFQPAQGMVAGRRIGLERLIALVMYVARSMPPSGRRVYVIRR